MKRDAIALVVTMFFIIAITLSLGIGMKYINNASSEVKKENTLLQTTTIINDILRILQNSQELAFVIDENSPEDLHLYLSQNSFVQFESSGLTFSMQLSSARSKFNPNSLNDGNNTIDMQKIEALQKYIGRYLVNDVYVDILLDSMSGIKEDASYYSNIFNEKPYLFREYITSMRHLEELNDFYTQTYYDNSLKNINFENLFYISSNKNNAIDVNYATPEIWELILDVDKQRAKQLSQSAGNYTNLESLSLSKDEEDAISKFKISYFEPYIDIKIRLKQNSEIAIIRFEYNIQNKKGSNFSYDI